MKKGISLILIIVMFILMAMLSVALILVINNNSSFFNIKQLKGIKSQMQENVNSIIYNCEQYMYQDITIKPGYIMSDTSEDELPKIKSKDYSYTINYDLICSPNVEISEKFKIYLDESGIIHLKYLFLVI